MTVELHDYTSGEKRVMGRVHLRGSRVRFEGEIPQSIRSMLDAMLDDDGDPHVFMNALPLRLSGSYLRAQLV